MTSTGRDPLRSPGFVGGVLGTAFAVAMGFGLVVPALPRFARELGASYTATSAVISVFAGVRLAASTPAGIAGDRVGARPSVIAGVLIVALSSAAIPLSQSALHLIVLRGAGGLGSALFVVGLSQYVVRTIPRSKRGRANGLLQGAFLLGNASGPAIGGLVMDRFGVRVPFVVYAGTLLVAAVVTWRYMTSRDPEEPDPPSDADAETSGVLAPPTGSDDASATGVGAKLFRDRTYVAVLFVYLAIAFGVQGVRFIGIPLFGTEDVGASGAQVGYALAIASAAQGLVLWPAATASDRVGRLPPLRVGGVILVLALVGFAFVGSVPALLGMSAVLGAAYGIASTVPATMAGDLAPAGFEGRAMGWLNVSRDVGAVTGPLAVGFLAQRGTFSAAFLTCGAVMAAALAMSLWMRETLTDSDENERPER